MQHGVSIDMRLDSRTSSISRFAPLAVALVLWHASPVVGQTLYTQDFDVNDTANWTVNDPAVTDIFADFFFDYNSVGIPPAPNSGGTTRGMILQANLGTGVFGGFSVSPTGQSFTGDFKIAFDYWGNTHQTPAGDGTSNLSYFGFGTSGTFGNFPGQADGVWFGVVADGDSGADYRVYSHDRAISYQVPPREPDAPDFCDCDDDATHYALTQFGMEPTRDSDAGVLYRDNFGAVTPPEAMQAEFPNADLSSATFLGSLAFEWHRMEIVKEGNLASWFVDGVRLIELDMSDLSPFPGDNILFGHSDITNGSPPAASDAFDLLFTLIDNVEVTRISTAVDNADFDGSGLADGKDFLTWQGNFEISDGTAQLADGDANDDGNVGPADLAVWQRQYGTSPAPSTAAAVPEPGGWTLVALATLLALAHWRCRDVPAWQTAPVRVR